jgi:hypothetical protein
MWPEIVRLESYLYSKKFPRLVIAWSGAIREYSMLSWSHIYLAVLNPLIETCWSSSSLNNTMALPLISLSSYSSMAAWFNTKAWASIAGCASWPSTSGSAWPWSCCNAANPYMTKYTLELFRLLLYSHHFKVKHLRYMNRSVVWWVSAHTTITWIINVF